MAMKFKRLRCCKCGRMPFVERKRTQYVGIPVWVYAARVRCTCGNSAPWEFCFWHTRKPGENAKSRAIRTWNKLNEPNSKWYVLDGRVRRRKEKQHGD